MRIPRTRKVSGRVYKIRRIPQEKMPKDDPAEILYGYCDPEKCEILLLDTLSPEAMQGTLEHELGHASSEESGARSIMEKYTKKAHQLEEDLCRVWLPVFLESLKRKATK